jgi:cytochrome c oxidase subunit I+III
MVYMGSVLNGQLAAVVVMAGFAAARYLTGRLDRKRRVPLECTALLTYYTAAQAFVGLLLVHGFPRAIA